MSNTKHIVCPECNAVNRIPEARFDANPSCGKCHKPIFNSRSVVLNSSNFQQNIKRNDIPVVIDFWAPWCGPCKMMAPAFEQAAAELSPQVRLAKLNTEDEQNIAGQFNIRSIPTLTIFKNGKEIARHSGAMSAAEISRWARNYS